MNTFGFKVEKELPGTLARTGVITTPHGEINTPAFITVGTKATVKAIPPEMVRDLGAQAVLANTYHLYLEPGSELVRDAGGLNSFMNWNGPTFTDSGGFQVFSLGSAFGKGVTKVATEEMPTEERSSDGRGGHERLAVVDDDGVTFRSYIDGSEHRFTPERSIQIQHDIGADIIVAFDECTSPIDTRAYQELALARTYRWAVRSLNEHKRLGGAQALYGVIQGGKYQDLREQAAKDIGTLSFDGFAIGGSFTKDDIGTAVHWVNAILPKDKPRHLLGIGEPIDIFLGVEHGVDTFDCVAPTRIGRNGALYTKDGRINIHNAAYRNDHTPIESDCSCYTCKHYTRAYLAHLVRSEEMLSATLASIHNLHFITTLTDKIRSTVSDGTFFAFKQAFIARYYDEKK